MTTRELKFPMKLSTMVQETIDATVHYDELKADIEREIRVAVRRRIRMMVDHAVCDAERDW